ncbi:response regulator transcription factor [Salisediminibacterium selenitireducens]|uniref:Two component transcriptional regulator, winged helix family n=1 Tax=Bacillus selenitireducens (strain ATCC 700615 / DSM 15326 / MLS10) TaxID=439292 RepID=D6Y150_BACIE|nr:response regulator transcription factor [Salisediminibacterium selenitireducens]ADH98654.1 two component transcriptional regulator, winged helix family [[Bacillus] selenitireducens MLS10]
MTEQPITVLIVDDEEQMREMIRNILTNEGYHVLEAADGFEAIQRIEYHKIHFVILDVMMPKLDGYETLDILRKQSGLPVLMLTAKSEESDKVDGLRAGADDYLTKPFGRNELLARMEAILRRSDAYPNIGQAQTSSSDDGQYSFDIITLNTRSKKVTVNKNPVSLTKKEFEMLELFIRHPEQVFSREQLLEAIWGMDYLSASSRTVDTHVKTLRLKLRDASAHIQTVWGIGYKLEIPR